LIAGLFQRERLSLVGRHEPVGQGMKPLAILVPELLPFAGHGEAAG
jgi:hypothetical protein